MSNFDDAINYVLKWEGGLEDNPSDPGGITNMGISLKFLLGCGSKYCGDDDISRLALIKNMTPFMAKKIYQEQFWLPIYDNITCQDVATYIFDMNVNMGEKESTEMAQRALWDSFPSKRAQIIVDGIFGVVTLSLINQAGLNIMPPLRAERAGFYRWLTDHEGEGDMFLNGWLDRTYGM
jgi:lysozyme family protein